MVYVWHLHWEFQLNQLLFTSKKTNRHPMPIETPFSISYNVKYSPEVQSTKKEKHFFFRYFSLFDHLFYVLCSFLSVHLFRARLMLFKNTFQYIRYTFSLSLFCIVFLYLEVSVITASNIALFTTYTTFSCSAEAELSKRLNVHVHTLCGSHVDFQFENTRIFFFFASFFLHLLCSWRNIV